MGTGHDLLTEPLIGWRGADRIRRSGTLPGVLAGLSRGELEEFAGVRPHQFHPWCMFLTQLATISVRRRSESGLPTDEAEWRAALLLLTNGAREPWCLVVDDLAQPAFFQPPVPEGNVAKWKEIEHPDELDILQAAKQHDVKTGAVSPLSVEAWLYAVVTRQTMRGHGGSGHYRIARMKSAFGSRARVGLAGDGSVSARFQRDVSVGLDAWPHLLARGFADSGAALVWMVPWDGSSSLGWGELTPHFIEVCSRIRLVRRGDRLACIGTTTTGRRCLAEQEDGDVGDIWIPIERSEGALTVDKMGFHYKLVADVLSAYEPAKAQIVGPGDPDPVRLSFAVLVGGQSKTNGLHERELLLSGPVRRLFGEPDGRAILGRRANAAVQSTQRMRTKVLYPALTRVALGGEVPPDRFTARADEAFFEELFRSIEMSDEEAQLAWERRLRKIAQEELAGAIERTTLPEARRYKMISEAEGMFYGCLRKQFPDVVAGDQREGEGDT